MHKRRLSDEHRSKQRSDEHVRGDRRRRRRLRRRGGGRPLRGAFLRIAELPSFAWCALWSDDRSRVTIDVRGETDGERRDDRRDDLDGLQLAGRLHSGRSLLMHGRFGHQTRHHLGVQHRRCVIDHCRNQREEQTERSCTIETAVEHQCSQGDVVRNVLEVPVRNEVHTELVGEKEFRLEKTSHRTNRHLCRASEKPSKRLLDFAMFTRLLRLLRRWLSCFKSRC